MTNLVAVYGTLRQGCHNNYLLQGCKMLGVAFSDNDATMYSNGGFPILKLSEPTCKIVVEVYEVPDRVLHNYLDRLEGYPDWYDRTMTPFTLEDGQQVQAWVYHQEDNHRLPIVKTGDWLKQTA